MDQFFTLHRGYNCFGAFVLTGEQDNSSPSDCAQACLRRQECEGFVLGFGIECSLRGPVSLTECSMHTSEYDTYLRLSPPPPPASPRSVIANSHNPATDPDYRKCWLHLQKTDHGLDRHVYFDSNCSAGMNGCGAFQLPECRHCGYSTFPACPYETKRVLLMGNSFLWSATWHRGFSVPRILKVLAPLFGYHPSVSFNAFYKWYGVSNPLVSNATGNCDCVWCVCIVQAPLQPCDMPQPRPNSYELQPEL